ncbi:MAG: DNA/RNA non-specific endonuclease [Bacteroidia bacterium]|nr:DNA/RNA non-specific endonuclease [Bacteroidia bacterium]
MKNKAIIYPLLVLLLSLIIYLFYPSSNEISTDDKINQGITSSFDYLPTSTTNQIIKHKFYTLSYNEKYEQAEWVAYELKEEHLIGTNRKRPYFEPDKKVKTKSANYRNYKNSGFSKGHLCPAGDRKFSEEAYNETFLTSNISPQKLDFNGGVWNRLEQKTRFWASKERHLYVITGGVLNNELSSIGKEKVAVPKYFYKILLDNSEPEVKAIAFLIPHKESKEPLFNFVVSIDSIEKLTRLDFFPALKDSIENQLEKNSNYKKWSF